MTKSLLFVGLVFFFQSALAQTSSPDLTKYLDFIQEWTSLKYNGEELPKIKVTKHDLVQIFAYGDFEYAQAEAKGIKLPQILATYDVDRKTIFVSDKLDLASKAAEITLVHELVHYLQDITGYTKSVNGHLACTESEAYDVQMLWQKINKIDEDKIQFVYHLSLLSATKCMGSKSSAFSRN